MVATAIFRRSFVLIAAAALTLLGTFFFGLNFSWVRSASHDYFYPLETTPQLHLIVPATASNNQFCKLLLSSGLVGFPEPVFLGWEGHGMWNGTQSHLFKISETLSYLRSLPADQDNDLVLLLDAYDIWLQMPPEVLISRYFKVLDGLNNRLRTEGLYGKTENDVHIKNSVLFGADKVCWPQIWQQPACWAVPNSTMDPKVFGPDTDRDMYSNRPRWLNSGTIMGPVKDVRDVFGAAMDMISRKFDEGFEFHSSDQYYFSELWAEQELRRSYSRDGKIIKYAHDSIVPPLDETRRAEFHITLDYGTDLFMTAGAYDHALTWMRYNHSTPMSLYGPARETKRIDEWTLPADLLAQPGPYDAADTFDDLPRQRGWADVPLGTNSVTGEPFPLLHMTGDKSFRDRWWPRMWFHPHSEELLRAKRRQRAQSPNPDVFAVIDGVKWRSVRPPGSPTRWDYEEMNKKHKKGGAWSDRGEYMAWERICGVFEDSELYLHGDASDAHH